MNQIEKVDCDLKNLELPTEETQLANPPEINMNLNHLNKAANPIIDPKDPLHNDSFLSKLTEIDEGLSKLKAGPNTINDSLNAEISINEHVINEDANETVRVSQVQGTITHASTRAAITETQRTQSPRQQGSWKHLNKADSPSKTDRISSTVESVLLTKRVYEELSHPNGLPRKKVQFLLRLTLLLWRRLMLNPAQHNESLSLEFLWAWEPMYINEGAWRLHPCKRSCYCVFNRDIDKRCKARSSVMQF